MADTLISGTTIIEDKRRETGRIWSAAGTKFHGVSPDVNDLIYSAGQGILQVTTGGIVLVCPVELPHGAKIINVIVYGNNAGDTWALNRGTLTSTANSELAAGNVNSEDTSITNAPVDNNSFRYYLETSSIASADIIYGARIIYE